MLPKLSQSHLRQSSATVLDTETESINSISKGQEKLQMYKEKYHKEFTTNLKLRSLLTNLKSNTDIHASVNEEEEEVFLLSKEKKKWEHDVQHQSHLLNLLIEENGRLKELVDSCRNKRAVYFNIYKDLEHEIHEWEDKYKNAIVEGVVGEGVVERIKDKFRKAKKNIEKDISGLKQEINDVGKKEEIEADTQETSNMLKSKKSRSSSKTLLDSKGQSNSSFQLFFMEGGQEKSLSGFNPSNENRHSQKKSSDYEYEIEQKKIEMEGIVNRLKTICEKNDLTECEEVYNTIDEDIEYNYDLFKGEEFRSKELSSEIESLGHELEILNRDNEEQMNEQIEIKGEEKLNELNHIISELEAKISEKIDLKVSSLSAETILHHCLRVKKESVQLKDSKESKESKELKEPNQLKRNRSKKEQPEYSLLLDPAQMHEKLIRKEIEML